MIVVEQKVCGLSGLRCKTPKLKPTSRESLSLSQSGQRAACQVPGLIATLHTAWTLRLVVVIAHSAACIGGQARGEGVGHVTQGIYSNVTPIRLGKAEFLEINHEEPLEILVERVEGLEDFLGTF